MAITHKRGFKRVYSIICRKIKVRKQTVVTSILFSTLFFIIFMFLPDLVLSPELTFVGSYFKAKLNWGLWTFNTTHCSKNLSDLNGPINPDLQPIKKSELITHFTFLTDGGRFTPYCKTSWAVAIIIPYRNSLTNLHMLLHNLIPILVRQKNDFGIFVIEQKDGSIFNRGSLFNIGFMEAENRWDCFIFHDVDLIPLDDRLLYQCDTEKPRHMISGPGLRQRSYTLISENIFVGVVAMTKPQFMQTNGFSNQYFGWGGEDDDLYVISNSSSYNDLSRDAMIKYFSDVGNTRNSKRERLLRTAVRRRHEDGVNTCRYDVLQRDTLPLYTWIKVAIDPK